MAEYAVAVMKHANEVPVPTSGASAGATIGLESTMIDRARRGDAVAFRWLFNRDAPAVRRFLMDLLRDRDAADEATQETFVRVHRGLEALRETNRWRAWLFGTARRVSLEQFRLKAKAPKTSIDDAPHPADRAPDPESALIGRESDEQLARALEQLSDERRAALLLRLDHGLDYDAIAEAMAWPSSKVKNEIHRARLELRAHLSTYGDA